MTDGRHKNGGARLGAGRKPMTAEEKQRRAAAKGALTQRLHAEPAQPKTVSWADKVPEEFKRSLSSNATRALIALGNAPAIFNRDRPEFNPFKLPEFPPGVVPKAKNMQMAMDDALSGPFQWASMQWAGQLYGGLASEGLVFPGYAYLSQLAIRPEYRIASETIADEMTRKWIRFRGVGENPAETDDDDDEQDDLSALEDEVERDRKTKGKGEFKAGGTNTQAKAERIKELVDFMDHLGVKDAYHAAAVGDGLFGRMHLFHEINGNDGSTPEGLEELKSDLGEGRGTVTKGKISPEVPLTGIRAVEPIWTYPTTYNALNPLRRDWYNPQVWYTQGQQIHVSRLFRFVSRPVPDLLKPSFSFGGLSLSQMMTPYVDIWLETRQSIARLVHSFSVMVLSTDMQAILQDPNLGGAGLLARVQAFNKTRDNQGTFVLNKGTEEFTNVSASLAGLHELQAQAQEHLCSVIRVPAVKYTGLQPTGLNASSEGEIKVFEDTIHGMQERVFRPHLTRTIRFCMLSLWGEVDEDIVFDFVPLRELSEKEEAEVQKLKAETWDLLMNGTQAIGPSDVRRALSADPDSDFPDLNPDDEPDLPEPREPDPGGKINLKGTQAYGGGSGNQAAAKDANPEWNEGDHPRAPDGKFGSGAGGGKEVHITARTNESGKPVILGAHQTAKAAQEHQDKVHKSDWDKEQREYTTLEPGEEYDPFPGHEAFMEGQKNAHGEIASPENIVRWHAGHGGAGEGGETHVVATGEHSEAEGGPTMNVKIHGTYATKKEAEAAADIVAQQQWDRHGAKVGHDEDAWAEAIGNEVNKWNSEHPEFEIDPEAVSYSSDFGHAQLGSYSSEKSWYFEDEEGKHALPPALARAVDATEEMPLPYPGLKKAVAYWREQGDAEHIAPVIKQLKMAP
jgi:hypothetical protein